MPRVALWLPGVFLCFTGRKISRWLAVIGPRGYERVSEYTGIGYGTHYQAVKPGFPGPVRLLEACVPVPDSLLQE